MWNPVSKAITVRKMVSRCRPDIVHAQPAVGYGLWGAVSGFHPFVVSAWGSDVLIEPKRSWIQARILRFVLRRADLCIAVARHLAVAMLPFGLRMDRAEVIPMGVDLRRHPPQVRPPSQRAPSFISTRGLEKLYDVGTLVRASPRIFEAMPGTVGTVLGNGQERPALERLAREFGIQERLRFLGEVSPELVFDRLASSAVYVSTSTSDGASVSLLEAMSQGCFPVVSDIPANREWVSSPDGGILFPVGDASSLSTGVISALGNPSLLDASAQKNIELVRERGDLGKNLERVEALYSRLLRGAG